MTILELKTNLDKIFKTSPEVSVESSSLISLRKEAKEALGKVKRPNLKHENWKYTSTRWLESTSWEVSPRGDPERASIPELSKNKSRLVFFDGVFSPKDSSYPKSLISITSLEKASQKNPDFLSECHKKFEGEKKEFFPLLSEAFLKEGCVIITEGNFSKEDSLDFIFLWTKENKEKAAFTKNYILMKENSSLCVKEIHKTLENDSALDKEIFSSSSLDIILEKNSSLKYKKLFLETHGHKQIAELRAHVSKGASFKNFSACLGSSLFRQDTLVKLAEERAETTLNGLYLASKKQAIDFCFNIKHEAPKTKSTQYFKSFATGKAKGIFQGNICVSENAAETRSKQLNKNLILGSDAEIYTKPQLQIDTDDVKCSHGATVSQVREDELFYLQTRGLSRKKALDFLISAFFGELLAIEKQEDLDIFENEIKNSVKELIPKDEVN